MNKQYNILQIISGLSILFLIVWNRFIHERKPQIFKDLLSDNVLFFVSGFCTLFFATCLLIELIRILKPLRTNYNLLNILNKSSMAFIFKKYIIESPLYVYEKVTENITLRWLLEKPASYFTAYFEYPRLFVILFYFIPQILVSTTFVLETILYDQRIYFIKIINILILLFLFKLIVFIFKHYSERRMINFEQFLDIKKDDTGIQFALRPPQFMPPNILMSEIVSKYNYMCQFWFVYHLIYRHMSAIDNFNSKYSSYIRIYTFICFFLAWFYLFSFFIIFTL